MKKHFVLALIMFVSVCSYAQMTTEFWGMTRSGGVGGGVLFRTDGSGYNPTMIKTYTVVPGGNPDQSILYQAPNGKIYGVTVSPPYLSQGGILFEMDTATHVIRTLVTFNGYPDGQSPTGGVMMASNGLLYGTTSSGGAYSQGILYSFDPTTETFTKLIDFSYTAYGQNPEGPLLEASNGKLYGVTKTGGTTGAGVLYEYDIQTSTLTKKVNFVTGNGSHPVGTLIEFSPGLLYGVTTDGGLGDQGTIFEYNINTSTYAKKLDLNMAGGMYPGGSLVQASNGKLYGMTSDGGSSNLGTLFEYTPSTNTYVKKIDFTGAANGSKPIYKLTPATNGKLYGLTSAGGASGFGVLFSFDPVTSTFSKLLDFDGYLKGEAPYGSLLQAADGAFYGMTSVGGSSDNGVLFKYQLTAPFYTKICNFADCNDGKNPSGSLLYASNGKIYGMTSKGGLWGYGVLFEYNRQDSVYSVLHHFDGLNTGAEPCGSLIEAQNGKLYGLTNLGGAADQGSLFEFDPTTGMLTKKWNFLTATGCFPYGSLLEASNGLLYGMTWTGGPNNCGTIFEYNPSTSVLTNKHNFIASNGGAPKGSLMQASNGRIYGMTGAGGSYSSGVIFEFVPSSGAYGVKAEFNNTLTGKTPQGDLTETSTHKLAGLCWQGGLNSFGTLFEFDTATNVITKRLDFDGTLYGKSPQGSLLNASNGKLYGMTESGGAAYGMGVVFEYDPSTYAVTTTFEFDGTVGGMPLRTHLIEICRQVVIAGLDSSYCDSDPVVSLTGVPAGGTFSGPGVSGNTFSPTLAGIGVHTIEYTNTLTGVCQSTYEQLVVVSACTGTGYHSAGAFQLFPNPASGTISIAASLKSEIEIFNSEGQIVKRTLALNKISTLDISGLAPGMYFAKVKSGEGIMVKKFIKQ